MSSNKIQQLWNGILLKLSSPLTEIGACMLFILLGCASLPGQTPFVDVTKEAGIDHQFKVYEGMFGGGICVFDLNKDGFEDFFIIAEQ